MSDTQRLQIERNPEFNSRLAATTEREDDAENGIIKIEKPKCEDRHRLLDHMSDIDLDSDTLELAIAYESRRYELLCAEGLDTPENHLRCEVALFHANLLLSRLDIAGRYLDMTYKIADDLGGVDSAKALKMKQDAQDFALKWICRRYS